MYLVRTAILFITLIILTGCLGYHASKNDYDSGYRETQIRAEEYLVNYKGPDGLVSYSALRTNLKRRAAALCPAGFRLTNLNEEMLLDIFEIPQKTVSANVQCVS